MLAFGLGYHIFVIVWQYAVWREYYAARILPLARVSSSLLSCGCTLYSASIVAFGLGYLISVTIWPYTVWREYYCLWPS